MCNPLENLITGDQCTDLIDCVLSLELELELGNCPKVRHQTDIFTLLENKQVCQSSSQKEASRMTELLLLI